MNLRLSLRPIFTVAWKDIRIILRYKTWFFAGVIWPIIFPFSFIFFGKGLAGNEQQGLDAFTAIAQTPDFASFLIIGNLVWMFINVNLWTGGLALRNDKVRGIFDTQMTMPVAKVSLVLGAVLASIIVNFLPMPISFAFFALTGVLTMNGNVLAILLVVCTIFPFLIGFLLMFSALTMRIRDSGTVVQVMRAILSILCGMQFPIAVLPTYLQSAGRWIPLTHFVRVLRSVIIDGQTLAELRGSIGYILLSGLVTLGAGIAVFEYVKVSVRTKGMVGGY